MGLHVGGIYVEAAKVTQADVVAAIEKYWTNIGAKKSALDPLEFEPLGLEETGRLGFVVSKALDGATGRWIAVYDSQRYNADPALARELAHTLGVDVWFYEITGSVDHAYAKRYGATEETVKDEEKVLEQIGPMPYALLYFNKLKEEPSVLADFALLAFEGIPHRPNAKYSGPSAETKQSIARAASAEELAAALDAAALIPMASEHRVMWEVIKPAVERADLRDPKQCAFVHALADVVLGNDTVNWHVGEACLRMGDRARFERAMTGMAEFQASLSSSRAAKLIQDGERAVGFAMLEQISRNGSARTDVLNNALHAFCQIEEAHALPAGRLDLLFTRAIEVGRANPPLFHNLACALVKERRFEEAVDAVGLAVKWGYEHIAAMKDDADLAPLRSHARWASAFEPPKTVALEKIVVRSSTRERSIVTIAPVVLLTLFFGRRKPALDSIADLLARIASELSKDTFAHYQWGSGSCHWSPIGKGKIARDITAMRKDDKYTMALRWGSHDGEPLGHRVSIELEEESGELDVMLPLDAANDPEALASRLASWAAMVPLVCGAAGYGLGIFEQGPILGPGSYAESEHERMMPRYLGFTASKRESGAVTWQPGNACWPCWLTFLGRDLADQLGSGLERTVAPARVVEMPNGVCIRAATAPFVGLATAPSDLGALPNVAKALAGLLPDGPETRARMEAIGRVAVPQDLAIPDIVIVRAPEPMKKKTTKTKK